MGHRQVQYNTRLGVLKRHMSKISPRTAPPVTSRRRRVKVNRNKLQGSYFTVYRRPVRSGWEPYTLSLTTDGQACDEHLRHQPLLEPLRRPTPRPIMIVHSRTSRSRRPSPEQRPFCSRPRCTVGVVHTCHVLPMTRLRLSSNFVIHAAAIDRQAFNNAQSMARCQRLRTIAASPWTRLAAASGTGLRVDKQNS